MADELEELDARHAAERAELEARLARERAGAVAAEEAATETEASEGAQESSAPVDDVPEEQAGVVTVALEALETVAELHAQEEETERTEAIANAAVDIAEEAADVRIAQAEAVEEIAESATEEHEPIGEEEQSEEGGLEAEEIEPPVQTDQPPTQEERIRHGFAFRSRR